MTPSEVSTTAGLQALAQPNTLSQRSMSASIACALKAISLLLFVLFCCGCGTTTKRIATEQLLISDAVDQAVSQIDFSSLSGHTVFVDTQYLQSVKNVGFVNSEYIISSLRQQLTAASCFIQDTKESADIVVEPRVGALGTDGHEVIYGLPQSGSIVNAASAFAGSPLPAIPEISIGKNHAQSGIAKLIVFAYDRESSRPIWQSGIAKAESTSSNSWFLGAGPFQKGSIYDGTRFAGQKLPPPQHRQIQFPTFRDSTATETLTHQASDAAVESRGRDWPLSFLNAHTFWTSDSEADEMQEKPPTSVGSTEAPQTQGQSNTVVRASFENELEGDVEPSEVAKQVDVDQVDHAPAPRANDSAIESSPPPPTNDTTSSGTTIRYSEPFVFERFGKHDS